MIQLLFMAILGTAFLFGKRRQPALAPIQTREISPEESRLLALLVLYTKDNVLPPGRKRYLSRPMAIEARSLAETLYLPRTVRAMDRDRPVPGDEAFGGHGLSVRDAVISFAKNWSLAA